MFAPADWESSGGEAVSHHIRWGRRRHGIPGEVKVGGHWRLSTGMHEPHHTTSTTVIPTLFRSVFGTGRWSAVAAVTLSATILAGAVITVDALSSTPAASPTSPGSDGAPGLPAASPSDPVVDETDNVTDAPSPTNVPDEAAVEVVADETVPSAEGSEPEAPADEQDEGPAPAGDEIPPHADDVFGAVAPEPMAPTPLEPVQASNPACEHLLPGRAVAATPVVVLPVGEYSGEITVHNCSDEVVAVNLSAQYAGTAGGAEVIPVGGQATLGFQVYEDEFDAGSIALTVNVNEVAVGPTTPVQVSAFKPSINDHHPLAADVGLSAGEHLTGCGNQCITTAWLSPRPNSADVGLELRSHTSARYEVYVRPAASSAGGFLAVNTTPWTTSPGDHHIEWTTTLSPLQPDTRYQIEVRAIDEDGHVSSRSTTFRTADPVDQLAGNDPDPACSYQCITEAVVTPTGSFDEVAIEISTNSPAEITVLYGTSAVQWNGTTPSIPSAATTTSPDDQTTSWTPVLDGLDGDTTYNVIVRAEDTYGRRSHQVGSFHTEDEPPRSVEVTFEQVVIQYDGDKDVIFPNKGELTFRWGVDNLWWDSRSEHKHDGGDRFTLDEGDTTILVAFDNETARILTITGGERDRDNNLCQAYDNSDGDLWRRPFIDCNERTWNPAPDSFTLEDVENLPFCSEFHMTGHKATDRCAALSTPDRGNDHPRFTAYVRFHFLPVGG